MNKLIHDMRNDVADLMIEHGPDGHCDGHEIIADEIRKKYVKPLVEALEFYADERAWDNDGCAIDAQYYQEQPNGDVDIEYFPDVGSRAREALAKLRGSDDST